LIIDEHPRRVGGGGGMFDEHLKVRKGEIRKERGR